jgi:diguanylate cyclase (GGDEF)-like protein
MRLPLISAAENAVLPFGFRNEGHSTMAGEGPVTPTTRRVRTIDPSVRTLAVESLRAIIGILIAFSVSWWISGALHLRSGFGGYAATAAIFMVAALTALTISSGLPIHDALAAQRSEILRQQGLLQAAADGHRFTSDLHSALEMAEHEPDVLQVIGRALDLVSDGPGELLLADTSRAHLHQGAASVTNGSPGCGVSTPWGCPAVRQGQILEFSDSHALATCPHLQVRKERVSALCVPVTVLGTPTGVIHLTAPADEPRDPVQRSRAEILALQTGSRLGLLRALVTSEIAATTDSLTGQLNRRSAEEAMRRLDNEQIPYAVAFADLDNFKVLNDTHGHAAGDRALRHFSTVTGATVRAGDVVCRFGGEEFLLIYVGCDVTEAAPIVHRLRAALAESVAAAGVPPFTVSVGLADSTYANTAAGVIAHADAALMTAKKEGRDRLIIAAKPEPLTDEASWAAG